MGKKISYGPIALLLGALVIALPILGLALFVPAGFASINGGGGGPGTTDSGSSFSCAGGNYKVTNKGRVSNDTNPPANRKYKNGSPKDFVPLYQAAAKRNNLGPEGPNYLASIHKTETGFGSNLNVSSAGALGHMQFMPPTWEAYGVDANGDGIRNPWDAEDAIFGAARYLAASGAPKDWPGAIYAYNHDPAYVSGVISGAKGFNIQPC